VVPPRRIVHVYGGNLYGGAERLLVTLAQLRALAPEMSPAFALCFPGRLRNELVAAGAEVFDLGPVRSSRPWQVRRARLRCEAWLRSTRADLVVCHAWWSHAIFSPAVRRARLPLVLWAHNCPSGRGWLEGWARRHRPDRALALGPYMANALAPMFSNLPAVAWLPPLPLPAAAPPGQRLAMRSALETRPDALVILQASRLEAMKGQRILLEAVAQLPTSADWILWMAGGAQRPSELAFERDLRQSAARLGIAARIRWLGDRDDLAAVMAAADVFCQPNLQPEPFGLVFAEAMAAGLPVVATHGGGPAHLLAADCARLAAPAPDAVAAALAAFLRDPELRARAGAAARERIRALCDPASQMRALARLLVSGASA